jgi:hypothetical protein
VADPLAREPFLATTGYRNRHRCKLEIRAFSPKHVDALGRRCQEAGVRPSMSLVDDCSNAMSESFNSVLECELLAMCRGIKPPDVQSKPSTKASLSPAGSLR